MDKKDKTIALLKEKCNSLINELNRLKREVSNGNKKSVKSKRRTSSNESREKDSSSKGSKTNRDSTSKTTTSNKPSKRKTYGNDERVKEFMRRKRN